MRRVSLGIVVLAVLGCAEEPDNPALPEMDDLARKTMKAWDAKEYHLGRAGVKRATCTVEATLPRSFGIQDAKAPPTTKGVFLWDGEKAKIRWEDEERGHEADYGSLSARELCASWFEPWWKSFKGLKLRGRRNDDGGVVIEYDHRDTSYALTFDAESVLAKIEWWGAEVRRATQTFAYERREGMWLLRGCETVSAEGAAAWTCRMELQHETVAGYLAPKSIRVVEKSRGAGSDMEDIWELRLTDWKFNDDAK
ncbi:MAG: hypothetical protein ACHQ1G_01445 [Planctomycetota bacterium]